MNEINQVELKNLIITLTNAILYEDRDWTQSSLDAQLYSIFIGYDEFTLLRMKNEHNWSDSAYDKLIIFHKIIKNIISS